jgi:hypothetical protein
MAHTPGHASETSPMGAAGAKGEALTQSIAGNIIQRQTLVRHPPQEQVELDEEYHRRIAIAAYYRAERRGFIPGGELEDWLAAEREIVEQSGGGVVG